MNSGEARTWRWLSLLSELAQAKLTEKITSTGRWAETPQLGRALRPAPQTVEDLPEWV